MVSRPSGSLKAEVVVPVHREDRPIRRAVDSVLACPQAGVVVVAHGIDPSVLDLPDDPRVRVVEVSRNVGKPGAAFNEGVREVTAPWLGIMGSDDWFEDGALDLMMTHLKQDGADGVIAPLRPDHLSANVVLPVTSRQRNLRGAKDRLFHRTAPLGLFRTEILQNPDYSFDEDVVSGEDLKTSTRLWTSGISISYYASDPAYVVGSDASSRVTTIEKPLSEHMAALSDLWESDLINSLSIRERQDLAEKIFQVSVVPLFQDRRSREDWGQGDFEWLCDLVAQMQGKAQGFDQGFTRTWNAILVSLLERDFNASMGVIANSRYLDNRLPARVAGLVHRHSWWRKELRRKRVSARVQKERSRSSGGDHVSSNR
ncbi:glycosyltransferase family 2 protein [Actinomycetaceae bacterium MB13-C1-2]|nr:glycosyltransferase family 2 protein [Actinomycetaceae bacterium MB13-C1-2]